MGHHRAAGPGDHAHYGAHFTRTQRRGFALQCFLVDHVRLFCNDVTFLVMTSTEMMSSFLYIMCARITQYIGMALVWSAL